VAIWQSTLLNQNGGIMTGGNQFGSGSWPTFPVQFLFIPFPAWGSPHTPPPELKQPTSPWGLWFLTCARSGKRIMDEDKALELVQFEPVVDDAWKPCDTVNTFITKNR